MSGALGISVHSQTCCHQVQHTRKIRSTSGAHSDMLRALLATENLRQQPIQISASVRRYQELFASLAATQTRLQYLWARPSGPYIYTLPLLSRTYSHAAWSACGQALGMITPAGLASYTAVVDRDLGVIAAGKEGLAGGGSRRPNTLVTGGRRRRKAGAAAVIMPVCGKDKSGSR